MATAWFFTPPTIQDRPAYLPDSTPDQVELWRHFENRVRGVTVWQMSDNSFVQETATPENSNTNTTNVYPLDPNNPSAPYVRAIYIDVNANPQVATEHDTAHSVWVVATFYGGTQNNVITLAQYNLLLNYTAHGTGYADCLSSH